MKPNSVFRITETTVEGAKLARPATGGTTGGDIRHSAASVPNSGGQTAGLSDARARHRRRVTRRECPGPNTHGGSPRSSLSSRRDAVERGDGERCYAIRQSKARHKHLEMAFMPRSLGRVIEALVLLTARAFQ